MRIIPESENHISYNMKEIIRKILYILKEDQSLNFGPRLKSPKITKKSLRESIASKQALLKKSVKTQEELKVKLEEAKEANDNIREGLLESLGSEL